MSTERKQSHRNNVDKSQIRAFRKAARELGLDESEERFQATLRTLAKAKPSKKSGRSERNGD